LPLAAQEPDSPNESQTMATLFLSYRRADSPDTVKLIFERLKSGLRNWEIFYDHQSIAPGEPFPERLRKEVTTATVVLVIIGPKWLQLLHERKNDAIDHVREEVRLAMQAGNTVIPVSVGLAAMLKTADLAGFPDIQPLASHNARRVRPDPDFDADIERLVADLLQRSPFDIVGSIIAGKYKVIRAIGEGGMGIVYAAEQLQPKRTVALKLIKPGMDTKDVLARFDAERQALAVMEHPNIAKVIDAGSAFGGRPFFVMEYVKGVPITGYCDDKKLTPSERLNLFRAVLALDQFHGEERPSVRQFPEVIHRHDRRVRKLTDMPGFLLKTGPKAAIFEHALPQHFHGHRALEQLVEAAPYLAHTAPSQECLKAVARCVRWCLRSVIRQGGPGNG
jgi:hypothetical protein